MEPTSTLPNTDLAHPGDHSAVAEHAIPSQGAGWLSILWLTTIALVAPALSWGARTDSHLSLAALLMVGVLGAYANHLRVAAGRFYRRSSSLSLAAILLGQAIVHACVGLWMR